MSNRKMRVGDQMMDLLTGEKKVIQSLSPEVTFEDGSKMKNPLCYKFIRNDNPFPVPKEITINDHTMVIDEVNVDCGHFRPLKVLHKYEGGLVLEALAKDQQHKILLSYAVETDRFFVLSEHAADRFDVVYDDGKIWVVRSERMDEVTDDEEPDENGDPVVHHPVFENLLIFNDYRIIETLSSDWMFGKAVLIQKDGDNKTVTLVFVSDKKRDEHGEPQGTDGKSRITRVTVSAPLEPEDENNPEEYGVETRTDVFLGTARKISLVPHGIYAPGLFVIGNSSILYSGERKRWADGADVAETAMAYPHLIRCDVDGDTTTTFVLANDQYETVRIRTEATSDRGLVSTIENKK